MPTPTPRIRPAAAFLYYCDPTMKLTREQSRQVDTYATEKLEMSSLVLMENAGRGCVDLLESQGINGPVALLCGKGNNGGDGFVIARHLIIRGYEVRVLVVSHLQDLKGDALVNCELLKQAGVSITPIASKAGTMPLAEILSQNASDCDWIVDALLGTGIEGPPRPPYDKLIEWINSEPGKKLAVDVPSGLDCNTGEPAPTTVVADVTATFVATKVGYDTEKAKRHLGQLHVLDIGLPPSLVEKALEA